MATDLDASAEESDTDEVTSLRAVFRQRRLSIATMDHPLRLATAGAIATVIAVVVLTALRDVHAPDVELAPVNGEFVTISLPLFVATLVVVVLGLSYLITAAVLASRRVGVIALALITAAIGVESGAFGNLAAGGFVGLLPSWARWTTRAVLLAVWLVAWLAWYVDRGAPGTSSLRLAVLGSYVALFGAYFTILWIAQPGTSGQGLFPLVVNVLMEDIVLAVYPVLYAASVDFAEWGGLLGARVIAAVSGPSRSWLIASAVTASLVVAGYGFVRLADGPLLSATRWSTAGESVLLGAGALTVILLVARALGLQHRTWPRSLNFAVVFGACALLTYLVAPLAGSLAGHPFRATPAADISDGRFTSSADVVRVSGGHGQLAYTMLVPPFTHHTKVGTHNLEQWQTLQIPGVQPGLADPHYVAIVLDPIDTEVDATTLAGALKLTDVRPQPRDGPWTVATGNSPDYAAIVWSRPDPDVSGGSMFVETRVHGLPLSREREFMTAIVHSIRFAGEAPAELVPVEEASAADHQRAVEKINTDGVIVDLVIVVAMFALFAVGRRRTPPAVAAAMLVFAMTTVATLLFFGNWIGHTLFGAGTRWPHLSMYGTLVAMGVLGAAALAASTRSTEPARQRLAIGLLVLYASTATLYVMTSVYGHALSAGRISVWAALIVLVAVAWDVTTSGESLTNKGSRHFPRATRVLGFLGYTMLLASTVLFFSAQRTAVGGHPVEATFETEAVTRDGLLRVGLPVAVLIFLLRFARARRGERGSR